MIRMAQSFCVFLSLALYTTMTYAQTPADTHAELQKLLSDLEKAKTIPETNKALASIKEVAGKLTTQLLALQEESGERILRDDFFLDKSEKPYVEKLTIRDAQPIQEAAAIIADAMLTVASKDHPDSVGYLNDWSSEEQLIVDRLKILVTPNGAKIWSEFLKEWRAEATRVESARFRDALVQAAYSILRVAAGVEKQHVENARKRIAQGGGTTATAASSTGFSTADRYPHLYHHHTRIMLRIQRHYSRW